MPAPESVWNVVVVDLLDCVITKTVSKAEVVDFEVLIIVPLP